MFTELSNSKINLRGLVWSAELFRTPVCSAPKQLFVAQFLVSSKSQFLVKEELISFSYTPSGMHNKKHCFH